MRATIAHISDIHFESLDQAVSERLTKALQDVSPNILVFTGDLVNNFWNISKGKQWLLQLCTNCKIDPEKNLLVVPGNHDYRLYGTFGFRPITGLWFRHHFGAWQKKVSLFPEYGISFLCFDSNPLLKGFARGQVSKHQLSQMRTALFLLSKADRDFFKASAKIALIHHHPVPVPYEGSDAFLFLNRAQDVIQFLTEQHVDLVLHGHKHRASNSMLELTTCAGRNINLRLLGAGTSVKAGADHDPRGHNFNLIHVENSGLILVQQYFAAPGEAFAKSSEEDPLFYQTLFDLKSLDRSQSRSRHKHWDCLINSDGDTFNEIWYEEMGPTADNALDRLPTKTYTCNTGHLSNVSLVPGSSDSVRLVTEKQEARIVQFSMHFRSPVTKKHPVTFGIQSWDFNTIALDRHSYRRKYPQDQQFRESEIHDLEEATDRLSWTLQFPLEKKPLGKPVFEVLDEHGRVHVPLTGTFTNDHHYSPSLGIASVSIANPPVGYSYRISWDLPECTSAPNHPGHLAEVERFTSRLLQASRDARPQIAQIQSVLSSCLAQVRTEIETALGTPDVIRFNELDSSLMVYDRDSNPAKLRVVAATQGNTAKSTGLELEVGDGIAGRAYKTNAHRCYDAEAAESDIRLGVYIRQQNRSGHSFLHSVPLRHADSQELIFGILNIGTYDNTQGEMLRTLADEKRIKFLIELGQNYVLRRVQEILTL